MKRIISSCMLVFILMICNCLSCKAAPIEWTGYYESIQMAGVDSFKCTYNVKGIPGLDNVIFKVNSAGFEVSQGVYYDDLIQEFTTSADGLGYNWADTIIPYSDNNSIIYKGSQSPDSFKITDYIYNVVMFQSCAPKLYLKHVIKDHGKTVDDNNYYMVNLVGETNISFSEDPLPGVLGELIGQIDIDLEYEYIEININNQESEIIKDGEDIYDRGQVISDDEVEIPSERSVVDDSRKKTEIAINMGFDEFNNSFMYGNTYFGVIDSCSVRENQLDAPYIIPVGLSNIKLNDETIEACLYKIELNDSFEFGGKQYTGYDEFIKEQYDNNYALVNCRGNYLQMPINKSIYVVSEDKSKSTLYYGEVCISANDYDKVLIQAKVNQMKAIYGKIENYNCECNKEKALKEKQKGISIVLEYNQMKENLGSWYDSTEGDKYAKYIQSFVFNCTCSSHQSKSLISPFTGVLTCDGLLGGKNSEIRKVLTNILKFIRYGGPILMLLLTIVDLVKTVTSGDDKDFKKVFNNFIKRFIAAVLLFFINDIIKLLFLIVGLDYNCVIDI